MLKTRTSILLKSGKRLLLPQQAARRMLQSPSDLPAVLACRDTDLYKRFKGIDLTKGIDVAAEDADIKPVYNVSTEEINALAEE